MEAAGERRGAAGHDPYGVPPAAAPAAARPLDVTVHGERETPAGTTTVDRAEIRDTPGSFGDPFRAIEAKPGVVPMMSGVPYFFIRGAPPGNIGFFYDGVQVPLLFHVGAGPGVIPPPMVRRMDLHFGPMPASIGRIAGAAIEAEANPPADRPKGEVAWRGIEASAVVESPLGDDLSGLAAGRWAFGAPLLTYLVPSVGLGYGDYQARVVATTGPESAVRVLTFGAFDYLAEIEEDGGRRVLLDTNFHRLDVRYRRSGARAAEAAITVGYDSSRGAGAELAQDLRIAARTSIERSVIPGVLRVRAGTDATVDFYEIEPSREPCPPATCQEGSIEFANAELADVFAALFPSRADLVIGGFVEGLVLLGPGATLTPGLRLDHYVSLGETAVAIDPRLLGRFQVTPRLALLPAMGIASQRPGFAPIPALQMGGFQGGLQRSVQGSLGAEWSDRAMQLGGTLFRHVTFGMTDPIGTLRGTSLDQLRFQQRWTGDAYGLELSARMALRRNLLFMGAYTLSRATRLPEGVPVEIEVPSAFDRTHVLHLALLYDLGNGWRAGLRHVFYTGFPNDEFRPGHLPDPDAGRTRPFYRFDARLSKRWAVGKNGWVNLSLDLQNATLSKEVVDIECDEAGNCEPVVLGPITIPALALEAGF
ncbi:MAG: TonB-dependent receptor [Polyangiaceae bacterium]